MKLFYIFIICLLSFSTVNAQFESASTHFKLRRQSVVSAVSATSSSHYYLTQTIGLPNFGRMHNDGYQLGPSIHGMPSQTVELPTKFALQRNYPNPFNSGTFIQYELAAATQMSLTVYSILGQKVCTLVDDILPQGSYTVHFSGRDAYDRPLPSGIYLVRMQTHTYSAAISISLLR